MYKKTRLLFPYALCKNFFLRTICTLHFVSHIIILRFKVYRECTKWLTTTKSEIYAWAFLADSSFLVNKVWRKISEIWDIILLLVVKYTSMSTSIYFTHCITFPTNSRARSSKCISKDWFALILFFLMYCIIVPRSAKEECLSYNVCMYRSHFYTTYIIILLFVLYFIGFENFVPNNIGYVLCTYL